MIRKMEVSRQFTFGKKKGPVLKEVRQILETEKDHFPLDWYFVATLLAQPGAIKMDGQLRVELRVQNVEGNSSILSVFLCQAISREYLDILKVGSTYIFKKGTLIVSHSDDNFVLMRKKSVIKLHNEEDSIFFDSSSQDSSSSDYMQYIVSPFSFELESSRTEAPKSQNIQSRLTNLEKEIADIKKGSSVRTEQIYSSLSVAKEEDLVDFKAKVVSSYQIGERNPSANKAAGFKVKMLEEAYDPNKTYEVVIWQEALPSKPLIRGQVYHFRSFKPRNKAPYGLSFHSHYEHSSIQHLS